MEAKPDHTLGFGDILYFQFPFSQTNLEPEDVLVADGYPSKGAIWVPYLL